MQLTRDELKDKIFELEKDNEHLKDLQSVIWFSEKEKADMKHIKEENQCWIEYYQQLLQELEQGE